MRRRRRRVAMNPGRSIDARLRRVQAAAESGDERAQLEYVALMLRAGRLGELARSSCPFLRFVARYLEADLRGYPGYRDGYTPSPNEVHNRLTNVEMERIRAIGQSVAGDQFHLDVRLTLFRGRRSFWFTSAATRNRVVAYRAWLARLAAAFEDAGYEVEGLAQVIFEPRRVEESARRIYPRYVELLESFKPQRPRRNPDYDLRSLERVWASSGDPAVGERLAFALNRAGRRQEFLEVTEELASRAFEVSGTPENFAALVAARDAAELSPEEAWGLARDFVWWVVGNGFASEEAGDASFGGHYSLVLTSGQSPAESLGNLRSFVSDYRYPPIPGRLLADLHRILAGHAGAIASVDNYGNREVDWHETEEALNEAWGEVEEEEEEEEEEECSHANVRGAWQPRSEDGPYSEGEPWICQDCGEELGPCPSCGGPGDELWHNCLAYEDGIRRQLAYEDGIRRQR